MAALDHGLNLPACIYLPWIFPGFIDSQQPANSPRRVRATSSRGAQGRSPKIHAEPAAPNGGRFVFVEVNAGGEFIVLVANVSLQGAQSDEARALHRRGVGGIGGRHQINQHVRAVGSLKARQAQNAFAVSKLMPIPARITAIINLRLLMEPPL